MSTKSEQSKHKDDWLVKILNSRYLYILLLIGVLVYVFTDSKVLNIPVSFFWMRFVLVLLLIFILLLWRYSSYKEYYKRKFRDKIYLLFLIAGSVTFALIIQGIINLPFLFYIKERSKNSSFEYVDCKISNMITVNLDKIYFIFKGRRYWNYFIVNGIDRYDLIDNYWLELGVRKSDFDTYVIESMKLKHK